MYNSETEDQYIMDYLWVMAGIQTLLCTPCFTCFWTRRYMSTWSIVSNQLEKKNSHVKHFQNLIGSKTNEYTWTVWLSRFWRTLFRADAWEQVPWMHVMLLLTKGHLSNKDRFFCRKVAPIIHVRRGTTAVLTSSFPEKLGKLHQLIDNDFIEKPNFEVAALKWSTSGEPTLKGSTGHPDLHKQFALNTWQGELIF